MVMTADKYDLFAVFHNIFILIEATSLYNSSISLPWNFLPGRKLRDNPENEKPNQTKTKNQKKPKVVVWM